MYKTKFTLLDIFSLLLIVLSFVLSFYFYSHFPMQVPTHWGFNGRVDGYSSRGFAAFFFPFLNLGMFLILTFIPLIDPHRNRYEEFKNAYSVFKVAIILFLTIVYGLVSFNGLGYAINISVVIPAMTGLLFLVMGSYLRKIKMNWFIGFRNPWTLSNEVVWDKTHLLAGKLFMLGGILMIITAFMSGSAHLFSIVALLVLIVVIPMIYSFVLYRKIKAQEKLK
jgi:uncharacterized membrane protein